MSSGFGCFGCLGCLAGLDFFLALMAFLSAARRNDDRTEDEDSFAIGGCLALRFGMVKNRERVVGYFVLSFFQCPLDF